MGIVFGGLLAGLVHVLSGPDHLAAVAPYATLQRGRAWRVGLRWGLGHTGGVLVVGVLALLLRGVLPLEALSAGGERLVGIALVAIGLWGVRVAARVAPDTFAAGDARGHTHHAAFGVGILHGLAGSSHLLGVLPALALPSRWAAGGWLLLFGVGTVAGMTAFAAGIGAAAGRLGAFGVRGYRILMGVCAAAAIGVGVWWTVAGGG